MEDTQEYILCAANWYPDLTFPKPFSDITPIYWLPQNLSKGIVFSGRHHLQCMYQCYQIFGIRQCEVIELQGFLTSYNRWVDRHEGGEIAYKAKQTSSIKSLFSEDIYYPYPVCEKMTDEKILQLIERKYE